VEREEALMRAMQEIQNTPPPVYLAELENEEEEQKAQFVIVPAVPLVDEKTPRGMMDVCKEARRSQALFSSIGPCPVFPIL
jgi:hypothetical protein